ncbi:MAG: signal peptide peptidase SppA [Planctomycetota bacterium]
MRRLTPLLALCPLVLSGCLPNRVVLDLAPGDGEFERSVVLTEPSGTGESDGLIVLIPLDGFIGLTPSPGLFQGRGNAVDGVVARLREAERDPDVRAVVLRINSPGGTASASETLASEIEAFRARTGKPIIASCAEVTTSGGYYAALSCDAIVAQPSTILGSIGVIVQTFNVSEAMRRLGIEGRAVTSRSNKDIANPFESPEEAHYELLQEMVDGLYAQFVDHVRKHRDAIEASRLDELTDGRVLLAETALEAGLIDAVGGVHDAMRRAMGLADLESASLVAYHTEGRPVRTPYASAISLDPSISSNSGGTVNEVNLVQFRFGAGAPDALSPGFYYLWWPGMP